MGQRVPRALAWLVLTLSLAASACAPWRTSAAKSPANKPSATVPESVAARPPDPAPALHIPGVNTPPKPLVSAKPVAMPPADKDDSPLVLPLVVPPAKQETGPGETSPSPAAPLSQLHQQAAQRFAQMPAYTMRVRRREVVGHQAKPEDVMFGKFRQQPFSVHFQWLGPEAKGREVVYVQGQHDNAIHTLTAAGDVLFLPAGRRISLAPTSPMVRARSRYPITEASLGVWIVRFGRLVDAAEKNAADVGAVEYLGELKRPEFDEKVAAVLHKMPPGWEPLLPRGGQRWWFFSTTHHLPALIITHDEKGREVEYYCQDQIRFDVPMTDDDFDPKLLWRR